MLNFFPKTPRFIPRSLSLPSAKTKASRLIALYGILFSFLFLGVAIYRPVFLSILDNKLYDVMHRSLAGYDTPLPLIVDIDEKSLAELGQWPWPRYHIAHLLEKLAAVRPVSAWIFSLPRATEHR
jgi:adenylate cyclase